MGITDSIDIELCSTESCNYKGDSSLTNKYMSSDVRRNRVNLKQSSIDINKVSVISSPSHSSSNSVEPTTEIPDDLNNSPPENPEEEIIPNLHAQKSHNAMLSLLKGLSVDISAQASLESPQHESYTSISDFYEHNQVPSKPNLIRANTTSPWSESDIASLEDEMKQELEAMVSAQTSMSISGPLSLQSSYQSDNGDHDNGYNESERGSNHTYTYTQTWCDDPKFDDDQRCISISSTIATTPSPKSTFTDDINTRNEDALDIPSYQLRNTISIDACADSDDATNASPRSGIVTIKYTPNLYRPDTTSAWDMSDIDDLQNDMEEQLLSLQVSMVPDTIGTFDGVESESKVTNLVQRSSCEWEPEDMELEENQMKKHLVHLQKEQSYSSSASISRIHSL